MVEEVVATCPAGSVTLRPRAPSALGEDLVPLAEGGGSPTSRGSGGSRSLQPRPGRGRGRSWWGEEPRVPEFRFPRFWQPAGGAVGKGRAWGPWRWSGGETKAGLGPLPGVCPGGCEGPGAVPSGWAHCSGFWTPWSQGLGDSPHRPASTHGGGLWECTGMCSGPGARSRPRQPLCLQEEGQSPGPARHPLPPRRPHLEGPAALTGAAPPPPGP